MSMTTARAGRVEVFLTRWRPILPLLVAEAILWIGFGAILPVLPLYMTEKGIDPVTLGLVVAAWPAARLFAEPAFGWLADRTERVPLMVAGLFISTVVAFVPLLLIGPVEFFVVRLVSGLGAAMYDPAARGFIVDATADDERGEAFGLYSAAQMGGFLVGPRSHRSRAPRGRPSRPVVPVRVRDDRRDGGGGVPPAHGPRAGAPPRAAGTRVATARPRG
jgi:MFS family permease